MFHRITLTAAAALLAAGPALAGGFAAPVVVAAPPAPVIVPATPVVVATSDWSGAYVGGQLGFGRLSNDVTFEDELGDEVEEEFLEGEGALYGVHAGYMFDFGRFVAGAEVDYDRAQIGFFDAEDETETNIGEVESVARAKLRLGYDAGRVLPYVTAGVARASFGYEDDATGELLEDTATGTFVGVGASFMASERFMVSIEGLRHNFDDAPGLTAAGETEFGDTTEFDTTVNTVSLRGSFRF